MKSFVFTMERMRNYKEQVLDKEKTALRRLRQKRDEIEAHIARVHSECRTLEADFFARQQTGVAREEITSFRFYKESARLKVEQLTAELAEANAAVEEQLAVVVRMTQEVSGLDKLEEKQQEAYRVEAGREERDNITEQISQKASRGQMQKLH